MKKVEDYIVKLMEFAPKTKNNKELQDELIADCKEKYSDLIKEGKNCEEAYQEVISSIGNIDELLSLHKGDFYNDNLRKKNAFVISLCIGLYIFAIIVAAVFDELFNNDLGGILFLAICGLSTCILIYNALSRPKYNKKSDTIVEEFKEWKVKKDNNDEIIKSIKSIIWLLVVIVYIIISFKFVIWYISWVIFLIGGLLCRIIDLLFKLGE